MNSQYIRKVIYESHNGLGKEGNVDGRRIQADYMNMETGWLIPNTETYYNNNLRYKINSLGCKGKELIDGVSVIGYFEDSGSFGGPDCWPDKVNVAGTQNLNASVEGHSMNWVIEQFLRLKAGDVNIIAGVFHTGWHNLTYNENSEKYWRSQLDLIDDLDVVALCTPHCCLTGENLERGVEELLCDDGSSRAFSFFGSVPATKENIISIHHSICRFN